MFSNDRLLQLMSPPALYGQRGYMVGSHAGWHASKGLNNLSFVAHTMVILLTRRPS